MAEARRTKKSATSPYDGRLARGREAKDRLVAAAIRMFGSVGFEGTSLRTIAQEAGVAFQLTNYHFGSKEDLWFAALTHLFDIRMANVKGRRLDPNGNLHEQLREFLRFALTEAVSEPNLRRIFTLEYFENSPRYRKFLRPKIEELLAAIHSPYEQFANLGLITRFSPREAELILRSVISANSLMPYDVQLSTGSPAGHQKSVERQVDLLFNLFTAGRGTQSAAVHRTRKPKSK